MKARDEIEKESVVVDAAADVATVEWKLWMFDVSLL